MYGSQYFASRLGPVPAGMLTAVEPYGGYRDVGRVEDFTYYLPQRDSMLLSTMSSNVVPTTNLAARYDASDPASLVYDSSNRVSLWADKSGNSNTNALIMNGVAGNYASSPDSAAVSVTGDIDIRWYGALTDWTPASAQALISKDAGGAQRSFCLRILSGGLPALYVSTDGSTVTEATASVTPTVNDYAGLGIRATRAASSGTVTFYTSTDFSTWTQLGTTASTTAGSIFDSTAPIWIGQRVSSSDPVTGNAYRAQIYNGIAGTLAFDANFSSQSKLATSFTESSANAATVTINTSGDTGARISGERDLYQGTVSKQPVYLAWSGSNYGYSNGTALTYSTTTTTGLNVAGDIDIVARISCAIPPASSQAIISKYGGAGQRSWFFSLQNDGSLRLTITQDGTTLINAVSSVSVSTAGIVSNSPFWVRVTRASASGNCNFYTGSNGVSWTLLGSANVSTTSGAIFSSTASVTVGDLVTTSQPWNGGIYRAYFINGIGTGTVQFDFNPATYTSGTTFTDSSSNAATITINAGATIVTRTCLYGDGVDDYIQSAAYSLPQPVTEQIVGAQVSWTAGRRITDSGPNQSACDFLQASSSPAVYYNAGAGGANSNWLIDTAAVVSVIQNGAAGSFIRVNRTAATGGTGGASNAMNGLALFSNRAGTSNANITASEIAIYSAALDTTAQDHVIGVLQRKWRI